MILGVCWTLGSWIPSTYHQCRLWSILALSNCQTILEPSPWNQRFVPLLWVGCHGQQYQKLLIRQVLAWWQFPGFPSPIVCHWWYWVGWSPCCNFLDMQIGSLAGRLCCRQWSISWSNIHFSMHLGIKQRTENRPVILIYKLKSNLL